MKREEAERGEHEQAIAAERLRPVVAMVHTFQHEVNNPFAVIVGNAQLQARRLPPGSVRDALDQIEQSGFRIAGLIKQLSQSKPDYITDEAGIERLVSRDCEYIKG